MWRGLFLVILLGCICLLAVPGHASAQHTGRPQGDRTTTSGAASAPPQTVVHLLSGRSTPTPVPSTSSPDAQNALPPGVDTAIVVALIGLLGTLILTGFNIFQQLSNQRFERERRLSDYQHEREIEDQRERNAEELERLKRQLEIQKAPPGTPVLDEAIPPERERRYLEKVQTDAAFVDIQTPDMSFALKQEKIYIPLMVRPNAPLLYQLEPAWLAAQRKHDPDAIFRAYLHSLEGRHAEAQPLDELVALPHIRCVLVSEFGGGKSTGLKYLARKAAHGQLTFAIANQTYRIEMPIYIDLGAFAAMLVQRRCDPLERECELLTFAITQWVQRYGLAQDEVQAFFQARLDAGQAIFLLDELDAALQGVDAEKIYASVIKAINMLSTRYEKTSIVVATRKNTYERLKMSGSALIGFNEWELIEFRPDQTLQFVTRWFEDANAQRVQGPVASLLRTYLACSPRLLTLASYPLFLFLLVATFNNQQGPPVNNVTFYARCIDALLAHWDVPRNRARVLSRSDIYHVLMQIAWHFHQQERCYFPHAELLQVITSTLAGRNDLTADLVLQSIIDETGLLKQLTQGMQASYSFICLPLQEAFVAAYALEHKQVALLLEKCTHPWWEEVILLYASAEGASDVDLLLRTLAGDDAQSLPDDLFCSQLVLAGRCLAIAPTGRFAHLQEPILLRLFSAITRFPDVFVLQRIATTLAEMGDRIVDTQVRSVLANVQANALDLYFYTSAPELFPLVANTSITLPVRKRAFDLSTLPTEKVLPELRALLQDIQLDFAQRIYLASILAALSPRPMVEALLSLAEDEQVEQELRSAILNALGLRGDRSLSGRLLDLLKQPATSLHPQLCRCLIRTLGRLDDRAALPGLEHFYQAQHPNTSMRWSMALAWSALGMLQRPEDVRKLQQLLTITGNLGDSYLSNCIWAISGIRSKHDVAQELLHVLADQHADQYLRIHLVEALQYLGEESEVIRALLPYWQDQTLRDALYQTLWVLSRRIGVRLKKNATGDALEMEAR